MLAAPVSGNAKVVAAGRLTMVVSGPEEAFDQARELLEALAARVTYVGDGDRARLVKICHNLMLGVVAQTLAEITVLAEKGGVSRADFFDFLNDSVMGSMFTRYKTPAYVNLDFKPTFTPALLLKDFSLGADAARELEVPMPVAAAAQQVVQALIGNGYHDIDFAALLELRGAARRAWSWSEDAQVNDGLTADRSPRPRDDAVADTEQSRTERTLLDRYGRMLLIRLFENEIHRLFLRGRGARHDAPVRRPGGRRRSASARARPTATGSPAPTAATATRWPPGPTPRRSWPRCSAARPACAAAARAR